MFDERLHKFEKTEPAWSDIASSASYTIIATSMVAFLLIGGLGYCVLR
jgi:hypothetical protein